MERPPFRDRFEIAIICALQVEYDAVLLLFDQFWDNEGDSFQRAEGDANTYRTGSICNHNVVITLLHSTGKVNAAIASSTMRMSYTCLRLTLLVGICGGVPVYGESEVLLGDVIISNRVLEYDFGKKYPDGFRRTDVGETDVSLTDQNIRGLLTQIGSDDGRHRLQQSTHRFLQKILSQSELIREKYKCPGASEDKLFDSNYVHRHHVSSSCDSHRCNDTSVCDEALKMECHALGCDERHLVPRKRIAQQVGQGEVQSPTIHIGAVASGDMVMKSATDRDAISMREDVIAFEMEGSGISKSVPCLVVKGVCDHSDSHKDKKWQSYAAATAASVCKAVLERYVRTQIRQHDERLTKRSEISESEKKVAGIYIPRKHSSSHFVGRIEYVERIAEYFRPRNEDDKTSQREFHLYGPGGFGKSQICLRFAEEYSKQFWRVFWIDATNKQTLDHSFYLIGQDSEAKTAGADCSIEATCQWLAAQRQEWLLIMDNAEGSQSVLEKMIPAGFRSNILISSRNTSLQYRVQPHQVMHVGQLSRDEAKQLLQSAGSSHWHSSVEEEIEGELGKIADELYCIPLALHHAATAMRSNYCRLAEYRDLLQEHRESMLANPRYCGDSGYEKTLYFTWSLTISLLENQARLLASDSALENTAGSAPIYSAVELLSIFAFFHHSAIPESIFSRAAIQSTKSKALSTDERLPHVTSDMDPRFFSLKKDGTWNLCEFRAAIQDLEALSLIQSDPLHNAYSVHPLIHTWSRDRLKDSEQQRLALVARAILVHAIPHHAEQYSPEFRRQLIPHMIALQNATENLRSMLSYADNYAFSFWEVFYDHHYYKEAEMQAKEIRAGRTHHLGEKHPDTLKAFELLAVTMSMNLSAGKLDEPINLMKYIIEMREATLPRNHPHILSARSILGALHQYNGNDEAAAKVYKSVWEMSKSSSGNTTVIAMIAAAQLSGVSSSQGGFDEAVAMHRSLITNTKSILERGAETPTGNMYLVAEALGKFANVDDSVTLQKYALKMRKEKHGEDHPLTIETQFHLAISYKNQKNWKEGLKLIIEATERSSRVLGNTNPFTLGCRYLLADFYLNQGQFTEAVAESRETLKGQRSVHGLGHRDTLATVCLLSQALSSNGMVEEVVELLDEVLTSLKSAKDVASDAQEIAPHLGEVLVNSRKLLELQQCASDSVA